MGYQRSSDYIQREAIIQEAIKRLDSKEFPLIRSATAYFEVPFITLRNRVAGMQSRTESYETRQILSNAEEKTIVRWVTRQAAIGFPVTPGLLKETAQEILNQRVYVASLRNTNLIEPPIIGHE